MVERKKARHVFITPVYAPQSIDIDTLFLCENFRGAEH